MQLAHEMKKRKMLLRARWLPRDQNQEADDLTNDEFRHFDPAKRIQVDLRTLGFDMMNELFESGDAYLAELERHRASEKRKSAAQKARVNQQDRVRAKKQRKLKETDPWP